LVRQLYCRVGKREWQCNCHPNEEHIYMFDNQLTDLLNRAERGVEAVLSSEETSYFDASDQRQLDLRIELGRTRLLPDDVQQLRSGSVVSLGGPLGDPAAIYADGQLVGRGEVVVVDGKIGVRVTELIQSKPLVT
jgi:flagellar motor switch protein FliN